MSKIVLDQFSLDLLVRRERFLRDTGGWTTLRSLWLPDPKQTSIDISWVKGSIDDFVAGVKQVQPANPQIMPPYHVLTPLDIRIKRGTGPSDPDRGFVITMNHVMMRGQHKDGCIYDIDSWGHQLQTFVRVGEDGVVSDDDETGGWRFRSFEQIYMKDRLAPAWPQKESRKIEEEFDGRNETRPCVKALKWSLGDGYGRSVRDDIPGYDIESTWKPSLEKHEKWLETGVSWF